MQPFPNDPAVPVANFIHSMRDGARPPRNPQAINREDACAGDRNQNLSAPLSDDIRGRHDDDDDCHLKLKMTAIGNIKWPGPDQNTLKFKKSVPRWFLIPKHKLATSAKWKHKLAAGSMRVVSLQVSVLYYRAGATPGRTFSKT